MRRKIKIVVPRKIERAYIGFLNKKLDTILKDAKRLKKFKDNSPLHQMLEELDKGVEDIDYSDIENYLSMTGNRIIEYITLKFPNVPTWIFNDTDKVFLDAFVSQNLLYFQSISLTMRKELGFIIRNAIVNGDGVPDIAKEISKVFNKSRFDAKRIAITETARASQQLSRKRFKHFGVDNLTWSSAHDKRVRICHLARDKKEYNIDDGCYSGCDGRYIQCGQEPLCRCASIGVIEF